MSVELFVRDLHTVLSNQINTEANKMIHGQCPDFEDYRLRVGFVRGLEHAAKLAEDLRKKGEVSPND